MSQELTEENWSDFYKAFADRQAGVSQIWDPLSRSVIYNAYCLEKKLLKEIMSKEFDFLEDALAYVNEEFSTWELLGFVEKKKTGCGSCAAKK